MMTDYSRAARLAMVLCQLTARTREQPKFPGQSVNERLSRPVSITLTLGEWHLLKGAVADAINAAEQPALISYKIEFTPKRRWWQHLTRQTHEQREQDIQGAWALLTGSAFGLFTCVIYACCNLWN